MDNIERVRVFYPGMRRVTCVGCDRCMGLVAPGNSKRMVCAECCDNWLKEYPREVSSDG